MEDRIAFCKAVFACSLLALLVVSQPVQASELEKWLIMPGPVIEGHAHVEADCSVCHAPLSEQPQHELCVDCHAEVGSDLDTRSGFHGRLPESERFDCAGCHTEHEGRDVDIVELDEADFDHTLTNFALHGAHTELACGDCHESREPHRAAATDCVACHRSDDVHTGSLGDDCGACHSENVWTEASFDHHSTGFPLTGGHAAVDCGSCHRSKDFADVGQTCNDCHRQDDVHEGRNGTDCVDCHGTVDWAKLKFNHMAISGFALVGGHQGLDCQSCHKAENFKDLGNSDCSSCHRSDDPHQGRFGAECGSCHNTFNWDSVQFDHTAETGFTLPPGHRNLSCDSCHTGTLSAALATDCAGCHAADDVHEGQLGERCTACHEPTSWTARVWFDHDIASFPLLGAHAELECEQCHASAAFHNAGSACVSCHVGDDPHGGSLGESCDDCHNPSDWLAWQFDHLLQTAFPLTGAHTDLQCEDCHQQSMGRVSVISGDCNACHRRDDPHSGRFGTNCESCHNTSSFSQIEGM